MKNRARLVLETLEARHLLAVSNLSAAGVLSITGATQDYVVVSNPNPATVEVFSAPTQTKQDFAAASVKSVRFQAGSGETTVYQTANLTAVLRAGNGASTYVLVGTAGINTLVGSPNAQSKNYLQASGNGQTFTATAGLVNIFGGGSDTITVSGANQVQLYDIIGTSKISLGAKTGYALVDAASQVKVTAGVQVVTFFQPAFQGPQTKAAVVQADANGHGVLYLNPLNPTANVHYTLNQFAGNVQVGYSDNAGASQSLSFPRSQIQWVSFFSVAGVSQVTDNTSLNDVFYGKSGSVLISGFGSFSVLKIHSGTGTAFGRAASNDLFAGAVGATTGATLVNNGGPSIFRNAVDKITTIDYGTGNRDTILIGPPAQADGSPIGRTGQAPQNQDFWQLFADLNTPGVF